MPTLRQLEYLVAVADLGHFGRAATAVHVSQPTLSQQLKALEARLGVALVERGCNPVQLTPVGREIVSRARSLLMQADEIRALARRSATGIAGTIRFGVTPTIGPYLMPAVVAGLHRDHPDMRLYIREGIPDDQVAELRRGGLDMMLAPLPVDGGDLAIEPLFREPLSLVAAPDNPLCAKTELRKRDFAGQAVLSLDPRHHFHRQALKICGDLDAELLRDYEGTSLDSLRQMAGSGIGLAILPELYLLSEAGGDEMVRRLEPVDWKETRSIAAIWREGSASAESFRLVAARVAEVGRAMMAAGGR